MSGSRIVTAVGFLIIESKTSFITVKCIHLYVGNLSYFQKQKYQLSSIIQYLRVHHISSKTTKSPSISLYTEDQRLEAYSCILIFGCKGEK